MKILCEVPLDVDRFDRSQFRWLRSKENYLFSFENERRLRMFSVRQDAGLAQEIQSASLAESRFCSSLSWNKDESILALVVDKRQIYFWDVKRNQFSHFKPRTGAGQTTSLVGGPKAASNNLPSHRKSARARDIEFIAWSKVSDKLAICYASGQILLCRVVMTGNTAEDNNTPAKRDGQPAAAAAAQQQQQQQQQRNYSTTWERFIDNSESVLKRIASIEVSEHTELFTCFSVISEILIMSFDGQTKFYCQGERSSLLNAKFSPPHREYCPRSGKYLGQSLHLACQSEVDGALYLKKISLDMDPELQDVPPKLFVPREQHTPGRMMHDSLFNEQINGGSSTNNHQAGDQLQKARLVDFHWLNPTHVLLCLESGAIQLIQLVQNAFKQDEPTSIVCTELFRIETNSGLSLESGLMSPASSCSRPPSRVTVAHRGSEDGSVASERSFALTTSTGHTSATANKSASSIHDAHADTFKMFELIKVSRKLDSSQCFALAAATKSKLFYYELYDSSDQGQQRFTFEHFDDIDLSDSLQRVNLELERAGWSQDCSMLALQVTSGHLLVYKTRLQHFMVASYGPRTAYLSAPNEVTILNYGTASNAYDNASLLAHFVDGHNPAAASAANEDRDDTESQTGSQATARTVKSGDNAIILSVQLKPSLLAIGPNHLALALNNRVRFYLLRPSASVNKHAASQLGADHNNTNNDRSSFGGPFKEQEYITIVVGISLSSRFVAIQFDDGRLKLHSIGQMTTTTTTTTTTTDNDGTDYNGEPPPPPPSATDDLQDNERFFPDPAHPESISAFTLTEELLVYCTKERRINVFGLKRWAMVQVCDHSGLFSAPISRLKPNDRGNKLVCLVSSELSRARKHDNVFLYDLYSNNVYTLLPHARNQHLWSRLANKQIDTTLDIITLDRQRARAIVQECRLFASRPNRLDNVVDAIWDTDGRTLLLVEQKSYHVFAVLCHTLANEELVAEYASSAKKPASYTTLYISQGVISFQTGLGRVINSIMETHDDELKLTMLELRVQSIKDRISRTLTGGDGSPNSGPANKNGVEKEEDDDDGDDGTEQLSDASSVSKSAKGAILFMEAHLRIALMKLDYLCTILPIYSLPKCRDICKHLMEDESFNLSTGGDTVGEFMNEYKLINQMVPKLLSSWSLYTLNLNFASLVYRGNNMRIHAILLQGILNDIKTRKLDSRVHVNNRILELLGCRDDRDDIN
jgi:hypothetical protein